MVRHSFWKLMVLFLCVITAVTMVADAAPAKKKKAKSHPKTAPAPKQQEEPSYVPPENWSLRDHYTLTVGKYVIEYAVGNSEWRMKAEGANGFLLEGVSFEITLGDGSVLTPKALGMGQTDRATFSNEFGKQTQYWSEYPAKNGLLVRHSISICSEMAIVFVKLELGNTGKTPIEITRIKPIVLGPAGIANLSPQTQTTTFRFTARGMMPLFDKSAPAQYTLFNDPQTKLCFAFGVLPLGLAASSADLTTSANIWHGDVVSSFEPAIRLMPGQKLAADSGWLTVGMEDPTVIMQTYGKALSVIAPKAQPSTPPSWVTTAEGLTENELYDAVGNWKDAHIQAALVPAAWEGRPGSMEGSEPRFPKNMANVASRIRKLGMIPGLTVDPLLASGGPGTAATADGRKWFNLSTSEGLKSCIEQYKKAVEWGFEFFVIQPSAIPNEALKQFNMSHVQADTLAFNAMMQAAPGKAVLSAPSGALKLAADEWNHATVSTEAAAQFDVCPGPIAIEAGDAKSIEQPVLDAMVRFHGPIEVRGDASGGVKHSLATFAAHQTVTGRPVMTHKMGTKEAEKTSKKKYQK